eukprot:1716733-Prymnesium_polylepis.1
MIRPPSSSAPSVCEHTGGGAGRATRLRAGSSGIGEHVRCGHNMQGLRPGRARLVSVAAERQSLCRPSCGGVSFSSRKHVHWQRSSESHLQAESEDIIITVSSRAIT